MKRVKLEQDEWLFIVLKDYYASPERIALVQAFEEGLKKQLGTDKIILVHGHPEQVVSMVKLKIEDKLVDEVLLLQKKVLAHDDPDRIDM